MEENVCVALIGERETHTIGGMKNKLRSAFEKEIGRYIMLQKSNEKARARKRAISSYL